MNIFSYIPFGRFFFALLATILLIYVLFSMVVSADEFIDALSGMRLDLLFLATVLSICVIFINTLRWNSLLTIVGYPLSFRRALSLVLASWTLSPLPGKVGDFLRSYPIRAQVPSSVSLGTLVFEKVIDTATLLLLSGVGFLLLKNILGAVLITAALALVYGFIRIKSLTAFVPEKWQDYAQTATQILHAVHEDPRSLVQPALSSIASRFIWTLVVSVLFLSLSVSIPFAVTLAYFPLALLIGSIPLTFAGIGIRDAALIAFFAMYASSGVILAAGVGYTFLSFFLLGIIGVPFFIREIREN